MSHDITEISPSAQPDLEAWLDDALYNNTENVTDQDMADFGSPAVPLARVQIGSLLKGVIARVR